MVHSKTLCTEREVGSCNGELMDIGHAYHPHPMAGDGAWTLGNLHSGILTGAFDDLTIRIGSWCIYFAYATPPGRQPTVRQGPHAACKVMVVDPCPEITQNTWHCREL
jgi:hypothetical protein